MKRPIYICITGPDGSGKSTVISRLKEEIEKKGKTVRETGVWDFLRESGIRGPGIFPENSDVDRYLGFLSQDSRPLFIFHWLIESLRHAREFDFVLLNGYIYKYIASEVALGADRDFLKSTAQIFPLPDLTFFLTVEARIAAERKSHFTSHECGLRKKKLSNFVDFQTRTGQVFEEMRDQHGWIKIVSDHPLDDIVQSILNEMNSHGFLASH